jgi:hypothetical protein
MDANFTEILNKEDGEQLFSRKSSVNWILIFHEKSRLMSPAQDNKFESADPKGHVYEPS